MSAPGGQPCWHTLGDAPLRYTNVGSASFRYEPEIIEAGLDPRALQTIHGSIRRARLLAPAGWRVDEPAWRTLTGASMIWRVRPVGEPLTCLPSLRLLVDRAAGGSGEIILPVTIEIHGVTQFDPARHALPFANSVASFGPVAPSWQDFEATYQTRPLGSIFFQGLYSQVLRLGATADGRVAGGVCTGMARSALEFSLRQPDGTIQTEDERSLRTAARTWHGKQLADRALLASTLAWLTRGSGDAYRRFRRGVLSRGRVEVAMDVNVPCPWRRNLLAALIGSGHTVVPYALRQGSDDRAWVWVYDPNYPSGPEDERSVIHFDLANDSYRYRDFDGRRPGQPSKVLAVGQGAYRAARSGVLGALLSLALFRSPRGSQRHPVATTTIR